MPQGWISVSGAREHNLQGISVQIPRNRLTVITGLSGSGKSSLAFDTLYAEGQRRYVESLSVYARQFLEQMQKPDVDSIEGLSPAIAIEQRTAGANPRSIVATTTEIHDYLRLLFANIGTVHCHLCGRAISRQSAEEIVGQVLQLPKSTRIMILAPIVQGRKGGHEEALQAIRKDGFVRVRVDGEILEIDKVPSLSKRKKHSIDVIVDRLVINDKVRSRLADSVETALKQGEGMLVVLVQGDAGQWLETVHSEKNACSTCQISFDTLTPRHFSFNSPYGACPTCLGLGTTDEFDEDLIVTDPSKSLEEGAVAPWKRGGRQLIIYYKKLIRAVASHYNVDAEAPFGALPEEFRQKLIHGSGEEIVPFRYYRGSRLIKTEKPFEGVIPNLARRYRETESEYTRQRLRTFMSRQVCPGCHGARLRPETLACAVRGHSITDLTHMSIRDAHEFFEGMELTDHEVQIVTEVVKEIRERLGFMMDVGLEYLTLDRESGTLSGGEAQRIRLATQIGAGLVGVVYVLDEPSIGLHQRDNRRLLKTLVGLRDLGNTVIVVEHDDQTIREADYVVDLGPGAGVNGGRVMSQGGVEELLASPQSLTERYLRNDISIRLPPVGKQPQGYTRPLSTRIADLCDGCVGQREEYAGGRHSSPRAISSFLWLQGPPGAVPRAGRHRAGQQGDRDRPVPDRTDTAKQPGDVHGGIFADPKSVCQPASVKGPGIRCWPVQLQCQGGALRGLPRRRHPAHRNALSSGRVR